MEDSLIQIEKELGEISGSVKSAHKRIDELQLVTKAFYDLASDVKVMVNEMTNMKKDIAGIKDNIEEYHHKEPNKLWFNAKNGVLTGVIAILVSALMALIMK